MSKNPTNPKIKRPRKKRDVSSRVFRFLVVFATREPRILRGEYDTAVEIRHVILSALDRATLPAANIAAVVVQVTLRSGAAGLAESLVHPLSKDIVDLFHALPGSLSESQPRKGLGYSARLFLPTPKDLEHDVAIETDERWLTAARLIREFDKVQAAIIGKLEAWLASLHGTTIECREAEKRVAEIKRVVARAGRELVFDDKLVGVYPDTQENRRNAVIRVSTLGDGPQETLYRKTAFPRLTTRPVE